MDFVLSGNKKIAKELANRIATERVAQNISQTDLHKKAIVSLYAVTNFEQTGNISFVNLISILKALGKTSLLESMFDFETERIEVDAQEYLESIKSKRQRASS